jgi:drug/metabolite transporter (DMT)-like permease
MKMSDKIFSLIFLSIPTTWAGSFIAVKFVVAEIDPLSGVFYRFFLSALVMFPGLIFLKRRTHPSFSDRKLVQHIIFVSLLSGVGYHIFFFWALKYTSPTSAALIIALNPFFTAFGEIVLFRQRRAFKFYLGFVLAFLGAIWVNLARGGGWQFSKPGIGELLCMMASLIWAAYTIYAKKTKHPEWDSMWINAYNYLLTAMIVFLLVGGSIAQRQVFDVSWPAWAGLLYMAIFPTAIGYTLFYIGVQRKGPAWAATFIYMVPSITALLDFIFFDAALSVALVFGTFLVVAGLLIGNVNLNYLRKNAPSKHLPHQSSYFKKQ